jgi:hypothetical protein
MITIAIETATPSSLFFSFGAAQISKRDEILYPANHASLVLLNSQPDVLLGIIKPKWEIIRPLMLTIEQDKDGYYIISDDDFLVYGYGKTQFLARQDYIISLIEYYQLLEKQEDHPTQAIFNSLQSYLSHAN